MQIIDLLHKKKVTVNQGKVTQDEAISIAVDMLDGDGVLSDKEAYTKGIYAREEESTTNVGGGIAIPHCKSDVVKKPSLAVVAFDEPIEYGEGEPVDIMFMIAAPNTKENVHLDVLARISMMLMHDEFKQDLMKANTPEEFMDVVIKAEEKWVDDDNKSEDKKDNTQKTDESSESNTPKILAVTSCPTGIAHTYMAKEALENKAKEMGVSIKVETNGSGGAKNVLTSEEIDNADCIIVAADAFVEMERFNGKKVLECPVSNAIKNPKDLIDTALSGNVAVYGKGKARQSSGGNVATASKGHTIYKHLMSGISHMIPFVVAGGILLAVAYMIDGLSGVPKEGATIDGVAYAFGSVTMAARIFHDLGGTLGLGLMFPILGGFIAYSIAGKPALVSGFVGGFAATKGTYSLLYYIIVQTEGPTSDMAKMLASSSAGFIGAIFAGFIAGYVTLFLIKKFENFRPTMQGIRDMMLIPLISTFVIGVSMLLLNVPFGYINIGLGAALSAMQATGLTLLLAAIVAGLMATDMGGPINKASHYFVLGLVTTALEPGAAASFQTLAFQLMAANIVGIMTPPVGIAIAIYLFPQKFSAPERRPALANVITGCCGITEGAIPYLAADFVRVLVACVTGAAVGGVVSMLLGMEAIAPEGGTISFIVMGGICWKGILAMIIGSLVTALILGALKRDVSPEAAQLGKWKGIKIGPKYKAPKPGEEKRQMEVISIF